MRYIFSMLLATSAYTSAYALHVAGGLTSTTGGRPSPALNAGLYVTKNILLSGSSTGTSTKAYYSNSYSLNVMQNHVYAKGSFGQLHGAIGLGAYYIESGIVKTFASDTEEEEISRARGGGFGPAFRVAYFPYGPFFFGVEFTLGVGIAAIFNTWGALGLISTGVEI